MDQNLVKLSLEISHKNPLIHRKGNSASKSCGIPSPLSPITPNPALSSSFGASLSLQLDDDAPDSEENMFEEEPGPPKSKKSSNPPIISIEKAKTPLKNTNTDTNIFYPGPHEPPKIDHHEVPIIPEIPKAPISPINVEYEGKLRRVSHIQSIGMASTKCSTFANLTEISGEYRIPFPRRAPPELSETTTVIDLNYPSFKGAKGSSTPQEERKGDVTDNPPPADHRWSGIDIDKNYLLEEFGQLEALKDKKQTIPMRIKSINSPAPTRIPYFHKTLVLELETLICIGHPPPDLPYTKRRLFLKSDKFKIPFCLRPGLLPFLRWGYENYEMVLYSPESEELILDILSAIPGTPQDYLDIILTQKHCALYEDLPVKSLSVMKDRDPKDIIIIDCKLSHWPKDLDNVVPLPLYSLGEKGAVLEWVRGMLEYLGRKGDVRREVERDFGVRRGYVGFRKRYLLFLKNGYK